MCFKCILEVWLSEQRQARGRRCDSNETGGRALGNGWLVEGPDGASLIFSSCTNSAALGNRRASDITPLHSHTIIKNGSLQTSVCFCLLVFRVPAHGSQY